MKSPYSLQYLKGLSASEWKSIKGENLRKSYQQVKEILHKRAKVFEKHGMAAPFAPLPSSRGLSEKQMRAELKEALSNVDYARRTYSGYAKAEKIRKSKIEKAFKEKFGWYPKTPAEWRRFDDFMKEMEARYGDMNGFLSSSAVRIYAQALRIGGDPRQFMKNFDYWEAHIRDLEKAKPVKSRSATPPKPSYFARKLGLEKIHSWTSENRYWSIDE